ncbi:putative glycosyl hydrolase family protein [Tanacetum coccineum]
MTLFHDPFISMILVSSVKVGPPHGIEVVEQSVLEKLDALAAAWLPGSEGNGITDVIFGDYEFHGQFPVSWFRTVDQLPMDAHQNSYDPLFPLGYGLDSKA